MRRFGHCLVLLTLTGCLIAACSDDDSANIPAIDSTSRSGETDTSAGSAAAQSAGVTVDCATLKDNMAKIFVNWQLVIGLANSETSEWGQIPIGSLNEFGAQLDAVRSAMSSDADAEASLGFMSGANAIVARGLSGDTGARTDLAAYMGDDVTASVSKQIPIGVGLDATGCN